MNPDVQKIVFDALHKGRVMRNAQRTYFATRNATTLAISKNAEHAFDRALEEAAYAVKHGEPQPRQAVLEF